MVSEMDKYPLLKAFLGEVRSPIEEGITRFLDVLDNPWEITKRKRKIGEQDAVAYIKSIKDPVRYALLVTGGKRVRPFILRLAHDVALESAGKPPHYGNINNYAAVLGEIPHRATVINDDIDDNTHVRNGKPTLHVRFNKKIARNAGNFLYFAAQLCLDFPDLFFPNGNGNRIGESRELEIRRALSQELRIAHMGQAVDLVWSKGRALRRLEDMPSEPQFYQMAAAKSTFPLVSRIGAILGGAESDQHAQRGGYGFMGARAGIAFQIGDDLLELDPEHPDFGEDIRGGNPTLPVIMTLQGDEPYSSELRKYLIMAINAGERDWRDLALNATQIMEDSGSMAYTRVSAKGFADKAIRDLRALSPDRTKSRQLMEDIVRYGVTRSH